MKITKPQLMQIIAEEVLRENIDLGNSSKVEDLLGKLLLQLKKLDVSIDYLSSAFTGEDPWTSGIMQKTVGRVRSAPAARMVKERKIEISSSRLKQIIKEVLKRKK